MAENERNRERGWWTTSQTRDAEGNWDIGVQFLSGDAIVLHLLPSRDLDLVLAAAVDAYLRGDRRNTKRSDRGS